MNKLGLVKIVAQKNNIKINKMKKIVEDIFKTIEETVDDGDKVVVSDFGTFNSAQRKEKRGKLPKSGDMVVTPARRVPTFKPGKGYRNKIKENNQKTGR